MLQATRGINTHKGMIFSMGCLLGASRPPVAARRGPAGTPRAFWRSAPGCPPGRWRTPSPPSPRKPPAPSGPVCIWRPACVASRGEVAGGFPSVLLTGLPTLRALLERGVSMERAGVSVLLALMAGRWIPTSSPGAGRRASAGPRLRRLGCWPRAFSPRRRRWRPWTGDDPQKPLPRRMRRSAGRHLLPPRRHRRLTAPGRPLAAPGHVLFLIPPEGLFKVLRLKVGPEAVHHKKVRVDRLDRQKAGQPPHPAPPDHQVHP